MKKWILLLLLLGISVLVFSTVKAETETIPINDMTEEEIKEAGYTPDSIMYGLERAMEKLRLIFAGSDEARARLHVQNAYERLLEARVMIQREKPEYVGKLLKDYTNAVVESEATIARMEAKGQNTSQIRAHVQEMTQKHIDVLQKVMAEAPESAQWGLQTAINNAQQRQTRMQLPFVDKDQNYQEQQIQEQYRSQPITQNQTQVRLCGAGETCELSLCDCECYIAGQTPEELTGMICGINCAAEYNVIGCECLDGMCKTIPYNINPGGQDNNPQ